MLVRSSNPILDGVFCGAQGAIVAGMIGLSPLNGAYCLSGISLTERIFSRVSQNFVPGSASWLGPIPVGLKNIVSYSLATLTTMKVMQVAGLIFSVPFGVQIMGVVSALILVGSCLRTVIENSQKPLEQQLQEHIKSGVYANRVFSFQDGEDTHQVRIIVNPEEKELRFSPGGMGTISCKDRFCIAYNPPLPKGVLDQIGNLLKDSFSSFGMSINSTSPLSYTANPTLA